MKRRTLLLSASAVVALGQAPAVKTHLKVGDLAPDFELHGTDGNKHSLAAYRGQKTVVLAFFPAAFTGGCTKEMTAYQAGIAKFQEAGARVFGLSTDSLPSLKHWAEEHIQASFPLLSDFSTREVAKKYGVLLPNGMCARTTFVIDVEGRIQHIEEGPAAIDPTGAVTACSRLKK